LPVGTERVVPTAFLGIGEDFVRLVDLLEASVLALVDVRMVLAGELAVRRLDSLVVRASLDAQDPVIVFELDGHLTKSYMKCSRSFEPPTLKIPKKLRGPGYSDPLPWPTESAAGRGSEGDVERHLAALEQYGQPVAFLHVLRKTLVVVHRAHLLAIDFADDVAALHPSLAGRAGLFDAGDDHTLCRLQVELARQVRRDRPHLEAEVAGGGPRRALLRLLFIGRFANLQVDRLFVLVAPDLQLGVLARLREPDGALQVRRRVDLLAVELEQDVARLQSRFRGRAVGDDVGDQHTFGVLGAERFRQLGGERLDRDAQPTPGDPSFAVDLRVDLLRHVGRNGEPDARPARDNCRIDPDDLTLHVHERPAGVAGVDGGVRLDEIVERALADVARLGADDARGHRGLEAER